MVVGWIAPFPRVSFSTSFTKIHCLTVGFEWQRLHSLKKQRKVGSERLLNQNDITHLSYANMSEFARDSWLLSEDRLPLAYPNIDWSSSTILDTKSSSKPKPLLACELKNGQNISRRYAEPFILCGYLNWKFIPNTAHQIRHNYDVSAQNRYIWHTNQHLKVDNWNFAKMNQKYPNLFSPNLSLEELWSRGWGGL